MSAADAPLNVAAPSVSGKAQQGATLTAASGSWSGATPINYTYQWQSCNAQGTSCGTMAARQRRPTCRPPQTSGTPCVSR